MSKERPILTGYMVLEGWAEDYSEWDGVITGPSDPTGANQFWEKPIPMIEARAYDGLREALDEIDRTLTIPAAEYVPAIGDVFKIIDKVKRQYGPFTTRARD